MQVTRNTLLVKSAGLDWRAARCRAGGNRGHNRGGLVFG